MGTVTSLALLFRGINVNLISELLPEKNTILNGRKTHMASQIAGGVFYPYAFERSGEADIDRMIIDSWNTISRLHAKGE